MNELLKICLTSMNMLTEVLGLVLSEVLSLKNFSVSGCAGILTIFLCCGDLRPEVHSLVPQCGCQNESGLGIGKRGKGFECTLQCGAIPLCYFGLLIEGACWIS